MTPGLCGGAGQHGQRLKRNAVSDIEITHRAICYRPVT